MDWLNATPAVLASLAVLFLPGFAVTAALRLRAFDAVALAPLVSASLISVGAVIASLTGLPWTPVVPVVGALLAAAAAFAVRQVLDRRWPSAARLPRASTPSQELAFFAGTAIAAVILVWQVTRVLGNPDSFSQSFDNIFHLNAVHYILETGDASSLSVAGMTAGDGPVPFYPAGWHGFASLVAQVSGAELTVAVNAANIAVAAALWPFSVMFAVRQLARLASAAVIAGGVLIASFPAFPILLLDFGVLYPNFFSLAMVPAGLALAAIVLQQAPNTRISVPAAVFIALLAYPGIALAHPNGMLTLLLLAVPLVIGAYALYVHAARNAGKEPLRSVGLPSLALLIVLGAFAAVWNFVRPPEEAAFWGPVETSAQAFGEALFNAPFGRPVAFLASVLAIVGVAAAIRLPRLRWLPASYLIATALFVIASGFERSTLRSFITGVYYNDPNRLAAILPLLAAPLSILGLSTVFMWLGSRAASAPGGRVLDSLTPRGRAVSAGAAGLAGVLVLLPLTQGRNMDDAIWRAAQMYILSADSALVSSDELELMDRIDEIVPEDATIAVNPYTGGALAFAFSDRDTTHRHTLDTVTEDTITIETDLRDADLIPEVCVAARNENLQYVLDFGEREVHGGDHRYPGIENLDTDPDFELVDQVGEAKLYKFNGCQE
ncbi:DUF6541 family protein [Arthrobacter caoxuetaonis]|uniref:Uncharacterized protein n=1 Tax=Arthrobacter caoxuetaonis TaxID=2886935 RepID=A0A9X1MCF7_9MICC|nr:DUF6541 family protein [Arthrobacter caoxuetaonis]MCC3296780.1 hypothetical protein [Arthrobacter caoxuetaonis]USQ56402.1 hypothetical protein NF551_11650 [Arthrobacter caoxuetaonis]